MTTTTNPLTVKSLDLRTHGDLTNIATPSGIYLGRVERHSQSRWTLFDHNDVEVTTERSRVKCLRALLADLDGNPDDNAAAEQAREVARLEDAEETKAEMRATLDAATERAADEGTLDSDREEPAQTAFTVRESYAVVSAALGAVKDAHPRLNRRSMVRVVVGDAVRLHEDEGVGPAPTLLTVDEAIRTDDGKALDGRMALVLFTGGKSPEHVCTVQVALGNPNEGRGPQYLAVLGDAEGVEDLAGQPVVQSKDVAAQASL